jgi:hypothetical protein
MLTEKGEMLSRATGFLDRGNPRLTRGVADHKPLMMYEFHDQVPGIRVARGRDGARARLGAAAGADACLMHEALILHI